MRQAAAVLLLLAVGMAALPRRANAGPRCPALISLCSLLNPFSEYHRAGRLAQFPLQIAPAEARALRAAVGREVFDALVAIARFLNVREVRDVGVLDHVSKGDEPTHQVRDAIALAFAQSVQKRRADLERPGAAEAVVDEVLSDPRFRDRADTLSGDARARLADVLRYLHRRYPNRELERPVEMQKAFAFYLLRRIPGALPDEPDTGPHGEPVYHQRDTVQDTSNFRPYVYEPGGRRRFNVKSLADFVSSGTLILPDGAEVTVRGLDLRYSGPVTVDFVISVRGEILFGATPHTMHIGGRDPKVLAAGRLHLEVTRVRRDGHTVFLARIRAIDNHSGHFLPPAESLAVAEYYFHKLLPNDVFTDDFTLLNFRGETVRPRRWQPAH